MATITLKNIPDTTYEALKKRAAEHRRSINSEVLFLIEKATQCSPVDPQEQLLAARKLREKTKNVVLTGDELIHMKNEGRP